jgi:hypothetical protein
MGQELTDIPFQDWVRHVFEHPVTNPQWHFDLDADCWNGSPSTTADYLARCFEAADALLSPFSDAQVNQGLWYLANGSSSDHMFALVDEGAPWPLRRRAIQAMYDLFDQCLARRCSPHLMHLDETESSPVNMICYMWWDLLPIGSRPDEPSLADVDAECLSVMERILGLDSDACRESALHGLGHWATDYPERVGEIIDRWMRNTTHLRPELQDYALAARHGSVQ